MMQMMQKLRLPLLLAVLGAMMVAALLFGLLGSKEAPASLAGLTDNPEQAQGKADRLVAEIVKRPLFTPGREPPHPKVVVATPPVLQGRLAGVVMMADTPVALFTRPGGHPVSVKEGQVIDGWTAAKIEFGRVVLTSSFGQQIVKPTNGSAEELTPGRRVAKKPPARNQPAKPGQPPAPNQKPQQMAIGAAPTGQK
jgi:hypothetical protein